MQLWDRHVRSADAHDLPKDHAQIWEDFWVLEFGSQGEVEHDTPGFKAWAVTTHYRHAFMQSRSLLWDTLSALA